MTSAEGYAHGLTHLFGPPNEVIDGWGLVTCIPQSTRASVIADVSEKVRVTGLNMQGMKHSFEYDLGSERRLHSWSDSIQGVTWAAAREGLPISGFEARIDSDVPMGSGLACSAALQISLLKSLNELFEWDLDALRLARIAQKVECEFMGIPTGALAVLSASLGRVGDAMLVDSSEWHYRRLHLDSEKTQLLIMHSGIPHEHSHEGHRQRLQEYEEIRHRLGMTGLRSLDLSDLSHLHRELPDRLMRRCRHIITENARVLEAAEALELNDHRRFGELLNLSHQSMRDDYASSTEEIDLLVSLAVVQPEVFGARLSGHGFGGSVVMLVRPGVALRLAEQIGAEYFRRTGLQARVLVPPIDLQTRTTSIDQQQWLI